MKKSEYNALKKAFIEWKKKINEFKKMGLSPKKNYEAWQQANSGNYDEFKNFFALAEKLGFESAADAIVRPTGKKNSRGAIYDCLYIYTKDHVLHYSAVHVKKREIDGRLLLETVGLPYIK